MEHNLVNDIAVCVIAAWVVAVASQVVRQPLLLAYLLAGFAVGPHGFKWVTDAGSIQVISHIGLSLLLFMIGLEIDLKRMISAGKVITLTAVAQIFGCVGLGWLFFGLFSFATGLARGALPRRGGRPVQHRHHRQDPLRQAGARHAGRPHHPRRAGAAGPVRDPVPGHPAGPQEPGAGRVRPRDAQGGAAGRRGLRLQPLRAAADLQVRRAAARAGAGRRARLVLRARRLRALPRLVAARWVR